MPLFDTNNEKLRKENLKKMEDKRVLFAQKLQEMGFTPERMLFCSSDTGNFTAIAKHNGKFAIITSPAFGSEEDFGLHMMNELQYEREDIFEKGTGLNGAFGFGTKGAKGVILRFTLEDGSIAAMQVVAGRTSWMEANLRKNPLLKTKRRRGDANIVWDFMPIDPGVLPRIERALEGYYLVK